MRLECGVDCIEEESWGEGGGEEGITVVTSLEQVERGFGSVRGKRRASGRVIQLVRGERERYGWRIGRSDFPIAYLFESGSEKEGEI